MSDLAIWLEDEDEKNSEEVDDWNIDESAL
jgi:hypothetical protein